MVTFKTCLVCGSTALKTRYVPTFRGSAHEAVLYFLTGRNKAVHGEIVQCNNCDFWFTNPQFEPEEYDQIYRNVSLISETGKDSSLRVRDLARRVRPLLKENRLLDIGCGDGAFLRALPERVEGWGIELSGEAEKAKNGAENRIFSEDLAILQQREPQRWVGQWDIVTAWDVVEHVPRLEAWFAAVRRALKPGGSLLITLPDARSLTARISGAKWNCLLLEHLWYFSPKSIAQFSEKFGFQVASVSPFPYAVDLKTLYLRIEQSFGVNLSWMKRWFFPSQVLRFPIGVMFVHLIQKS